MDVTLTIDGKITTVPEGTTILEAASSAGIYIPTLCHHPDLSDVGACRMCVVSVKNSKALMTSCTTPATDGMVVNTETDEVRETRRFVLEVLLTDHPNDCMTCEADGECKLQNLAYDYGVRWTENNGRCHDYQIDQDPNPFIAIDRNKCILCGRCVRACGEIQNRDVWLFAHRGFQTKLIAGADQFVLDAGCESCGQCVAYCPVGALSDKMSLGLGRQSQVAKTRTTCSYCGVGCNFDLNVRDGRIIRVTSAEDAPVNGLSLCVKGRYGYDYVHHPDRLVRPLVRAKLLAHKDVAGCIERGEWKVKGTSAQEPSLRTNENGISPDTLVEIDWNTALDIVADRLADIKNTHGGDALAVLASAKCTNEENYL
ncbi:MAG: 2Fe-2S iron-sulfur cluster-binding protein, partial [Anaerolineae bacterium]|nr:2Fe-2S iron-sulfur cluster-binding protein [Anaerolineae bacterium]